MKHREQEREGTGRRKDAILIVDDDSNNLGVISELLGESDFTIFVAEDGETALDRAILTRPDLILLDVLMPGIDGFETCRRLKGCDSTRDIPVIFMTALAETDQKIRGFEAGAVDYITKPLRREEVLARVGVHLRLRHLTNELREANQSLERRVHERTATLARTNEALQQEIAERKLARQALEVKQKQLEALNADLERRVAEEVDKNLEKDRILFHNARLAALGELVSNIAHQWRQPLNSIALIIQGSLYDLEEGKLDRQTLGALVDNCMEQVSYMSNTINEFQSFFRPGGQARQFDPYDMVAKSVALVRAGYQQDGIALRVVNQGTLPVTGFDIEFSQVILNLLNNARDVLLERRIANPAVEIRCCCRERCNVITIRDNAGGVPEEVMDNIFDPYFTTKFKSQGTGIGLYMSKMIIEKYMGGRLSVRNSKEGAEFQVEVPVGSA